VAPIFLAGVPEARDRGDAASALPPGGIGPEGEGGKVKIRLDRVDGVHELLDVDAVGGHRGCHAAPAFVRG
jgi:hypothetical protein